MGRLSVSRKRQRSEQDLLLSSTLTTEEWKAEQQLERDAQASTTVPVKNEACAPSQRACEQEFANSQVLYSNKYSNSLAWIATQVPRICPSARAGGLIKTDGEFDPGSG